MKWLAHYIAYDPAREDYWRTVHADDLTTASREAEKLVKKGYVCLSVKQESL